LWFLLPFGTSGGFFIRRSLHETPTKKLCCRSLSNRGTPWAEANFKQIFSIVVHRVAPGCSIEWID